MAGWKFKGQMFVRTVMDTGNVEQERISSCEKL